MRLFPYPPTLSQIPSRKCEAESKEVCRQAPRQHCEDLGRRTCRQVPRKECRKEQVRKPRTVCTRPATVTLDFQNW